MNIMRLQPSDFSGKVIDCHSHLGVTIKGYANREYPYAQTAEGLYYRQISCGVDVSVVFPFAPELYFDLPSLIRTGIAVPAAEPFSAVPYAFENEQLMTEVYRFCPEHSGRFITFAAADPGRDIPGQVSALSALAGAYPLYGIKLSPVLCQSPITGLLEEGRALVEFARERNIPMLIHSTVEPRETYSQVSDILRIAEVYPDVRFCLAHCAGFDKAFLERADAMSNVWVDTAALKIQVELAALNSPVVAIPGHRFDADYSNHLAVMQSLVEAYPDTILWGSDSPAYSYICRRKQADGVYNEFRLKACYEDEKAALDALLDEHKHRVANKNTRAFIFG